MSDVPIEELDIGTMAATSSTAGGEHPDPAVSDSEDGDSETAGGTAATIADIDPLTAAAASIEPIAEDEVAMHVTADAVRRAAEKIGIIHTSFPEQLDAEYTFEGIGPFPVSYRTLNAKERLLLLFAENFRQQFGARYGKRRPPIMALCNECGVQKFVSTTIRPTYVLHTSLIGSWEAIAAFVADFVHYEPLVDQLNMPQRLMSPDTLLRRRLGNSFEMATLLVSLLINNGFRRAYVVAGYASREVVNNDQRRIESPYMPGPIVPPEPVVEKPRNKYALKDPPDMRSTFLAELEERAAAQASSVQRRRDEDLAEARKLSEKLEPDPLHGKRVHAWVLVLIPGTKKAAVEQTSAEEVVAVDESTEPAPTVIFIEPSTGFAFEANDPRYMGVESAWNHENYYVNRQETYTDVANIKFNFANTLEWEHLLPGEPTEQQVDCPIPDDIDGLTREEDLSKEKHLDMPASWVNQLHIGLREFEERYPNGTKVIHFMRAIYERFAPYHKKNGMTARLTTYDQLDYTVALKRWEWYTNRQDLLQVIIIDFQTKQLEEYFVKGRPDCLKYYTHSSAADQKRVFEFYHVPRLDSLMKLEVHPLCIRQFYSQRKDRLYYREFTNKERSHKMVGPKHLIFIQDKFHRNEAKVADQDMAVRNFDLVNNTIFIQFQYADNSITASTRTFVKPPKPDYECEIIFDPESTRSYNCNPSDVEIPHVDQYLLLLDVLAAEESNLAAFEAVCQLVETLLATRKRQMSHPRLNFDLFDPLRNAAPRQLRLARYEQLQQRTELALKSNADFVAPYLVHYAQTAPNHQQSVDVMNACLTDMRTDFVDFLNELQRRYDEHVSEALHFKRFLKKFHDQFDDFDYDRLIKEGELIEVNKRMIQQRLITTREQSQAKYERVKRSLLQDERLNFNAEYRAAMLAAEG